MGKFFFISVLLSLFFGTMNGKINAVSAAALEESAHAVELSIKLLGSLCFWSGIMALAEKSGLVETICDFLKPMLGFIFPALKKEKKALGLISMNVSANLLGLGNAATPFGISAMKELHRISGFSSAATKEMVCFAVMNTASLQILPTTVASLRLENGAENPMDILPAVWFVSACSLIIGISAAKLTFPERNGK